MVSAREAGVNPALCRNCDSPLAKSQITSIYIKLNTSTLRARSGLFFKINTQLAHKLVFLNINI